MFLLYFSPSLQARRILEPALNLLYIQNYFAKPKLGSGIEWNFCKLLREFVRLDPQLLTPGSNFDPIKNG